MRRRTDSADLGGLGSQHVKALLSLSQRLQASAVRWALCAGANLALHGVPVAAHDIDVLTDASGAYEICRLFPEAVVSAVNFSSTGRIRSHFGALELEGIRVEIMGDMEIRGEGGEWQPASGLEERQWLDVGGVLIPVLSLEHEWLAYARMGREEKAAMLRSWLDRRPSKPQPTGLLPRSS